MAIHHAQRGELVDLNDWPTDLDAGQSHVLIKTDQIELARLVIPEGKEIAQHKIASPIVIQCLSGSVELATSRARQSIGAGQLLHLEANDPYSLTGLKNAVVLLTIIFTPQPDPGYD